MGRNLTKPLRAIFPSRCLYRWPVRSGGRANEVPMLSTIRGKFAAVLFIGLVLVCATVFGLNASEAGENAALGQPALLAGMLTLVVMLLIESSSTRSPGLPATSSRSRRAIRPIPAIA